MRAAVIGANWGGVHVAALREAGVEVVALAGRDAGRIRTAADRLAIPQAVTDLAQIAGLDVDLVSVATPAASHLEVIAALPGHVPVLCEKPAVGLSPLRPLPERSAPVWVNYAFAFLDVSRRAVDAVDGLGTVRRAQVRSTHDLGRLAFTPRQMFMELVPHPWSWLVALLGAAEGGEPRPSSDEAVSIGTHCGDVPVELTCEPEPGLDGLSHEVVVDADGGRVRLRGRYQEGLPWVFGPPILEAANGEVRTLDEPEAGPGDPWYRANARAIRAVVAAVEGDDPDPRLFDWSAALRIDRAAQAGLARKESHDRT